MRIRRSLRTAVAKAAPRCALVVMVLVALSDLGTQGVSAHVTGAVSPTNCGAPVLTVAPSSGPGGTEVLVTGTGFCGTHAVVRFVDYLGMDTKIGSTAVNSGSFSISVVIPSDAARGRGRIKVISYTFCCNPKAGCFPCRPKPSGHASAPFRVTRQLA